MPKMKTHKGAKGRFKVTGSGKVLQQQQVRGVKRNRPKRSQRRFGKALPTSDANKEMFREALPYKR
jgi:large subunit ribosomal protein L35